MKWRILLELTETTGSVQTREMVTGDRPTNVVSPESIGLSLAESKSILAAMQTQLVQAQTDGYCDHRRKCSHCGSRCAIKDWRTRQLTTLFGVVRVEAPRFDACRCGIASRRIVSPLAEIMPDRCTPEYERVLSKMGSRDRLKVGGVMRHDIAGRASIGREQCGLEPWAKVGDGVMRLGSVSWGCSSLTTLY